ncbi:peptidoglycan-binding domain-containing protein [Streptomyces sp. Isolate_219]|uniref:peptidoglycan-binding domain-containing protein n=1 Tax=Streptomyces sp. Isolate_219 TaxID=2950110 RepID=UPI0021C5FE94|nr:peptidoglycan-binding domain-containing protein [Streptomyces sp. Isolate_219]MCR8576458.1 peptidoglycan-binding protein [Streptomyces sp. Isolate_219]
MDSPSRPARVVWHTTESGAGDAAFSSVGKYLISIGAEPHILYDPTTDRLGQFGPLGESARALRNDGSTRTNRTGKACIQIEVMARAGKPFTGYWKPGPNFRALMAAIRSWGIPDVFPMGAPAKTAAAAIKRDRSTWLSDGGHYGHCNVPGNDHWDPGAISTAKLFAAAPASAPSTPSKPKPTTPAKKTVDLSNVIAAARRDPGLPQGGTTHPADVKLVEAALKAEGLLPAKYAADGSFGTATRAAYKALQMRYGYRGADADGIPGMASLSKLGSKHGFGVKA